MHDPGLAVDRRRLDGHQAAVRARLDYMPRVLHGLTLGAAVAAVLMRMTRSAMLDVIGQDYVRTARAKGLSPGRTILRHALRNAFLPVLTVIGIQTGYLLGGTVVVEEVFSLNGVGRLALRAVGNREYALLQAILLMIGGGFLVINLLVDLAYAWINPKISVS
jgi:peptide/nickel transport system permease protein